MSAKETCAERAVTGKTIGNDGKRQAIKPMTRVVFNDLRAFELSV